jgi:hypothetical protein
MGFLTAHGHFQSRVVHVLALLHDPAYREANAGALRNGMAGHPAAGLARW